MFLLFHSQSKAQCVKVRMNFPMGVTINAPGPAPYRDAVWIGPEWRWQGGQYVHVPGYWARPGKHHRRWMAGHWKYKRGGYYWVPGRWR